MHNSKMQWFRAITFLIIFVLINEFLIFAICPETNNSSKTILEMYYQKENIDVVFAGSSYSTRINPYIMDEELGCNTFDYGFNGQTYIGTYYCLKELFKYHKPKIIVLSTDSDSYTNKEEDKKSYMAIILSMKSFLNRIEFYLSSSEEGSYLNRLFIWPEYPVRSLKDISRNISKKLNSSYINYPQEKQLKDYLEAYKNKKSGYIGKGFLKVDTSNTKNVVDNNKIGKIIKKSKDLNDIQPKNIEYLKKIVNLCNSNNTELILLHTPTPVYSVFREKNYFKFDNEISKIAQEYDIKYYDYNLIKPEIFKEKPNYFQDSAHLNGLGSEIFSKSFAEFLKLRSSGEDMSKYFYTPEEYFNTINYINNTWFTWKRNNDNITLVANSFYGNDIKPEYQFILIDSKTGKKEVIRDYDINPKFTFKKPSLSKYKIRVNAREVGNNNEFTRYYEEEFGKK